MLSSQEIAAKIKALEDAQVEALKVHRQIELSAEYGDTIRDIDEFYQQYRLVTPFKPSVRRLTDEKDTARVQKANLEDARERLQAAYRHGPVLRQRVSYFLAQLERLGSKVNKRALKTEAVELVGSGSTLRSMIRRDRHVPSRILIERLRRLDGRQNPRALELIESLEPWQGRRALKVAICDMLERASEVFGDRRPRRIRVTHASTKDLRLALEEIQRGLMQVNSAEKIQAVNDEIDRLCLALDARVALAKTRADCLRQAELIKRELQSEGRALGASLKRINREINEEEAALRRERRALLSARERLQHLEAEALLDNHIIERIQDELTGLDEDAEADEIEAKQVELSRLTDLTDAALLDLHKESIRCHFEEEEKRAERRAKALHIEDLESQLPYVKPRRRTAFQSLIQREKNELTSLETELQRAITQHADKVEEYARALETTARYRALNRLFGDNFSVDRFGACLAEERTNLCGTVHRVKRLALRREIELVPERRAVQARAQALVDLESRFHELTVTRNFCLKHLQDIDGALEAAKARWQEFKDTDAVIMYVDQADDYFARLISIARLIQGNRGSLVDRRHAAADAMGRVRLVLFFEAGVRFGFEFGFAEIAAKVSAAIQLSGELAVTDSREFIFSHHLTVFFCASATARVGIEQETEPFGLLPVPDVIVEAGIRCNATLYDVRGITVYESPRHWATRWAHQISRRITLLKQIDFSMDWFKRDSAQILDRMVDQYMSSGENHVRWFTTLRRYRELEPRKISVSLKGFDASVTLSAGAGGRPVEKTLGSKAGKGEFELKIDGQLAGVLTEDALLFSPKPSTETEDETAPRAFLGEVIYHQIEPSPSEGAREFIEVRKVTQASTPVGPFTVSRSSSYAEDIGDVADRPDHRAVKKRRALTNALEANPKATYVGEIRLPQASLTGQSSLHAKHARTTSNELKRLEKVMRYRIDLLESQGRPTTVEKLFRKFRAKRDDLEKKLQAIDDAIKKLEKVAESGEKIAEEPVASSVVPTSISRSAQAALKAVATSAGAGAEQASRGHESLTEKYDTLKDSVSNQLAALNFDTDFLERTHNSYMRWTRVSAIGLNAQKNDLTWTARWTPQVYRGMANSSHRFEAKQSLTIAPGVSAFFKERVTFQAESLTFEVLGLGTFTYLKSIFMSYGNDLGRWQEYYRLHEGELFDLFQQVATPGSLAFSEVVKDALEGPLDKANFAAEFGRICWHFFNRRENPFKVKSGAERISKAAVIQALLPPNPKPTPSPLLPPLVPIAPIPSDTIGLSRTFLRQAVASFGSRFQGDSGTSARRGGAESAPSVSQTVLERICYRIRRRIEIRDKYVAELKDGRISRSNLSDETLLKVIESNLATRREQVSLIKEELVRLRPLLAGEPDYERRVGVGNTLLRLLSGEVMGLSVIFEVTRMAMLEQEPPHPDDERVYQQVVGDLMHAEYREDQIRELTDVCINHVYEKLREPSLVPGAREWVSDSKRHMPAWARRTERTLILDDVVRQYHEMLTTQQRRRAFDDRVDYLTQIEDVLHVADQRRALALGLTNEINAWHSKRAESKSARTKNTACYLELPCLKEADRCEWAMLSLSILSRMIRLTEVASHIKAGIIEYRKAHDEHASNMEIYHVELERYKLKKAQQTLENSAVWVSRRAQRMRALIDEMPVACASYLKAFRDEHRYDGLFTGRQKTLAPGRSLPMFTVASEPVRTSTDATSTDTASTEP